MKRLLILMLSAGLMLTSCVNKTEPEAPARSASAAKAGGLKIAFVQIDTLTNQYKMYKDASDNFAKKQANAENTINQKGKTFASQVQDFQRKVQSNALTQDQYNNEQARLQKFQQDIQDLQTRLSNSLMEEQQKELQTITDTIKSFLSRYAKEKGYDFILCKSSGIDNVLYASEAYDVTDEVVSALNKIYAKTAKKAAKAEKADEEKAETEE